MVPRYCMLCLITLLEHCLNHAELFERWRNMELSRNRPEVGDFAQSSCLLVMTTESAQATWAMLNVYILLDIYVNLLWLQ